MHSDSSLVADSACPDEYALFEPRLLHRFRLLTPPFSLLSFLVVPLTPIGWLKHLKSVPRFQKNLENEIEAHVGNSQRATIAR